MVLAEKNGEQVRDVLTQKPGKPLNIGVLCYVEAQRASTLTARKRGQSYSTCEPRRRNCVPRFPSVFSQRKKRS